MVPDDARAEIARRLDAIVSEEGVQLLFAVESGSRAWGFPSPDSDYDVRFVYARPLAWYLALDPRRDVVERPIEGLFDVNGWDLQKALRLLLKSNPVLLEWLDSPVVYRESPGAMSALRALALSTAYRRPCLHHYAHLAGGQRRALLEGRPLVPLKKYFYVLRPALALRWLRLHDSPPPMALAALRAGADLPPAVEDAIDALLERKAATREIGDGPRIPALDAVIDEELAWAAAPLREQSEPSRDLVEEANALFRRLVGAD